MKNISSWSQTLKNAIKWVLNDIVSIDDLIGGRAASDARITSKYLSVQRAARSLDVCSQNATIKTKNSLSLR